MEIYKIGPNYFSSLRKAEDYRKKYYVSNPFIETITLDPGSSESLDVSVTFRIDSSGAITNTWANRLPDEYEYPKELSKYWILEYHSYMDYTGSRTGIVDARCTIKVGRMIEAKRLIKKRYIIDQVLAGLEEYKNLGYPQEFKKKIKKESHS